jgi:hypothetical protein
MRHERLGQHEWTQVVRRERHIPAQRVLRGARLVDPRVVEQADDRKMERDDLRGRLPHARNVGEVTHDCGRALAFSLDGLSDLVEFLGVTSDQHDRSVLGKLQRRSATYLCRRSGR